MWWVKLGLWPYRPENGQLVQLYSIKLLLISGLWAGPSIGCQINDCGGVTLAGCQMLTQPLSLSLLNMMAGESKMKKLVGQDKDREITYQLLSQENRLDLGKINLIYNRVGWQETKTKLNQQLSPTFLPGSISFPTPIPSTKSRAGG